MDDHDGCQPGAAEPGDQFVGYSLRNHDRQPGVDPQPAEVRDVGQLPGQLASWRSSSIERIAAAENHFVDRRVSGDLSAGPVRRTAGLGSEGRENAGGSRNGNGRQHVRVATIRSGHGTFAAARGRSGHRPRPADRRGSRGHRPVRPPAAGPARAAGRRGSPGRMRAR